MNAVPSPAGTNAGRAGWSFSGIEDRGWDRRRELLDGEAAAIVAIGPACAVTGQRGSRGGRPGTGMRSRAWWRR